MYSDLLFQSRLVPRRIASMVGLLGTWLATLAAFLARLDIMPWSAPMNARLSARNGVYGMLLVGLLIANRFRFGRRRSEACQNGYQGSARERDRLSAARRWG